MLSNFSPNNFSVVLITSHAKYDICWCTKYGILLLNAIIEVVEQITVQKHKSILRKIR